jgi:hypothetical protein
VKQSRLRVDPGKVREFQDRSRQPLARDPDKGLARDPAKALQRRAPLGANREVAQALSRSQLLDREDVRDTRARQAQRAVVEPSLAKQRLENVAEAKARSAERKARREAERKRRIAEDEFSQEAVNEALKVRFKARRPARAQTCKRCKARKATGWHHWVPQEHLRVMMRSVAKANGLPASAIKRKLRQWLRDEGNLTPYCHGCHMDGEHSREGRWVRGEVPAKAWRFAQDLDDELEAAGVAREATVRLTAYPEV